MQGFNVADYQDDEFVDHQTISECCNPHMYHLLISGWSIVESEHVLGIDDGDTLQMLYSDLNGDGFIYCLDLTLDSFL